MRFIAGLLSLCLWAGALQACEVCGCGSGGSDLGLVPLYQTHMLSVRSQTWQFRYPGYETVDRFQQLDLQGRLYLHPRWILMGQIPYRWHSREEVTGQEARSGLGDVQASLHHILWRTNVADSARWQQFLQVGLGAKAPTAAYQAADELGLPAHFNLGTGAWDALGHVLYQARRDAWGVVAQGSYRWRGTHVSGYRFGDQASFQTQAFRVLNVRESRATARMGMATEFLRRDVDGKFYQEGTGGQGLFAILGADFFFRKRFSCTAQMQWPLAQEYASGDIKTGPRIAAQIQFFIR